MPKSSLSTEVVMRHSEPANFLHGGAFFNRSQKTIQSKIRWRLNRKHLTVNWENGYRDANLLHKLAYLKIRIAFFSQNMEITLQPLATMILSNLSHFRSPPDSQVTVRSFDIRFTSVWKRKVAPRDFASSTKHCTVRYGSAA